jgi:hypothetical protein
MKISTEEAMVPCAAVRKGSCKRASIACDIGLEGLIEDLHGSTKVSRDSSLIAPERAGVL